MDGLPKVSGTAGCWRTLAAGTHKWCACGLSKAQPLCDDSHRGTGIEPLAFVLEVEERVMLCLCKHTASPPYCDGSHARFAEGESFDEYL